MLNLRTLLFGLIFATIDAISLPTIKSVHLGSLSWGWMVVPFVLYAASPFLFLHGLKSESLTILNLVWDLSSDVIITLIGLFFFMEQISYTKMIGVCLSFISLFLMTYESPKLEQFLHGGALRVREMFNSNK
jgi:multidrug transporter EmrE-like cation transporter